MEPGILDTVVDVNPRFVFREEADGAFLFDPDTDTLRLLNETGAFLFKMADGTRTVGQLVDALAREFGEDPGDVAEEAGEFIEELIEKELLIKKAP